MMMKKCITLLVSVFLTLAIYSTIVQSEHTKSNLVKVKIYVTMVVDFTLF